MVGGRVPVRDARMEGNPVLPLESGTTHYFSGLSHLRIRLYVLNCAQGGHVRLRSAGSANACCTSDSSTAGWLFQAALAIGDDIIGNLNSFYESQGSLARARSLASQASGPGANTA